jgi:hypothetical protein
MEPAQPNILEIEWLSDDYQCDMCGSSHAEGAIVRLNNRVILELMPRAYCYSSETYDEMEVYDQIMNIFGVQVIHSENSEHPPINLEDDDEEPDSI